MPLYEYYCSNCDGIFEYLRSMREASDPSPCPVCDRDAVRVMPTSFAAFTYRQGVPRRIPDNGNYYHLRRAVKNRITGGGVGYEHPELDKPVPSPTPSQSEMADLAEQGHLKQRHLKMLTDSGITPAIGPDYQPALSPDLGASGHAKR